MIIFDTETTGIPKSPIVDLSIQPRIIEFAAIKLDDETLEQVDKIEFLVNPNESLPEETIKITGITDDDLRNKDIFVSFYPILVDFFIGERYLIAHNVAFDLNMLLLELKRIGRTAQFPYPPVHICTVNKTKHLMGYDLKLEKLYSYLFGEEFEEAHRAMKDVEALVRITKELIKREVIKL